MKKITKLFVLTVASMVALASCQKAKELEGSFQPKVLKAVFEDGLKTSLSENFQIEWSSNDAITGFDLDRNNYTSTATTVSENKLEAEFTFGTVSLEEDLAYVIYPADEKATMNEGGVISTTLPLVQNAVAGSFDPKANVALADGGVNHVKFLNGGALLALEIKNDGIVKVELEAGSYENFAGPATLNFVEGLPVLQSTYSSDLHKVTLQGNFENGKTYYAVVFPAEYTSLKMVFTRNDGKTATYTNSKSLSVSRNSVTNIWKNAITDEKWQGGESEEFDATMAAGTNGAVAVVKVGDVDNDAIKVGTSKAGGDMKITVGAGAKSLSFYAAAWKGSTDVTLEIAPAANVETSSVVLTADEGMTANTPFTLVGNESAYKFTINLKEITAETTFTLSAGTTRFVVWGAKYSAGDTPTPPTPTKYTISVADGIVGGSVSASATEAEADATVTLTATPATGYEFESWNVTNASTSAKIDVVDNQFTMPAANVNVSATFKKQQPGNSETYTFGEFTSAQDVTFNGSDITIEFHKGNGSTNPAWNATAEEARVYAKGYVVVSSSTKNIAKVEYAYVINANNKGVSPTVDSVEGATDKGEWDSTNKTWTGSDSEITLSTSGSAGNIGFTSITVYFGEGPAPVTKYDVTCATVTGGTISANPTKAAEGATVTLTAEPNTGYEFESWNVTGATVADATSETTTFTMPAANVNVSATFKEKEVEALKTMDEIFAAATTAGSIAADVKVTFNNWVISGVKNSNAYLTDNNGKGLIIYASNHGFAVGDILSGTVNCKVQLYNGSAELTTLTSSTAGLTVTKGGSVTPASIAIKDLGGINTGVVLTFAELTYNGTVFSDGEDTITPYNTFMTLPTLVSGKKYSVTGVYIQFKETKEIAPRTTDDIVEKAAPKYNVNIAEGIANGTVSVDYTQATEGQTVTITTKANTGFKLKTGSVKVTKASGGAVTVTDNKFTMPAEAVTVSAEFEVDASGETTVSIDFSKQGYSNAQEISSATVDANVTVSFAKGESSNAPKYYNTGTAIRCYGGNTLTVTATGKTITAVKLTFGSGDGTNVITTDVGSFTSPDWSGESESVVFTIGGTTGHRRIKTIEVTYK